MRINKILFIIAGAAIILGALISGAALAMGAGRADPGEKQMQTAPADISRINIKTSADDISITPADTDKISVTYTTGRTKQYDFRIDGNTLSLTTVPRNYLNFKWYDYISFNIGNGKNKIEMTVPLDFTADFVLDNNYGDIYIADVNGSANVDSDCGNVRIERCGFSELNGDVDYGNFTLDNVTAGNMKIDSDCGDIIMTDVTGNLKAYCDYGSITLDRFFGENITLENDCGNISGTILGSEEDYNITAKTDFGKNNLQNRTGGVYNFSAFADAGSIDIQFLK